MKFREGDKVRCIIEQYLNFQMLGEVAKVQPHKHLPYVIRWMEGEVEWMGVNYGKDELELVCNKDRNCTNCKHKLKCITS